MKVIQPIPSEPSEPGAPPPEPIQPATIAVAPPAPAISPVPAALPATAPTASQSPSAYSPDSIVAKAGLDLSNNVSDDPEKANLIVAAIWVIGGLIAVPAILDLIGFVKIISFGNSANGISVIYSVAAALLGVGIIMRREIARLIYVVLAVIGLILASIGLLSYLGTDHAHLQTVFLSIFLSYFISLLPLIFLTRPKVKAEFN